MSEIRYLNTDLDLRSASDLRPLAAAFTARGLFALHVDQRDDGLWHASFEASGDYDTPAATITALLSAIESLDETQQGAWRGCTLRELNVGYDCGTAPRMLDHDFPHGVLGRMAAAGASLRITLYAPP